MAGTQTDQYTGVIGHLTAGADLSAVTNQGKIVKQSAQTVILAAAATDKLLGILRIPARSGEAASVLVLDGAVVQCVCGAAVAVADEITSDSSGRGVATTTGGDWTIGRALTATSNANELFSLLVSHGRVR
jgi:hypothetical protein